MTERIAFEGFVKDVRYHAALNDALITYDFDAFDLQTSRSCGLVRYPEGVFAYSRWVSPKRTRSYPFEKIYNTYNAPLRLTIIPVIKDEGRDGEFDRIQYSTVSWMNLLNIYIVLAYYEDACKNTSALQTHRQKLTGQKLNLPHLRQQITEILRYKQSALHWNRTLMEDRFAQTYRTALDRYEAISTQTGIAVHPRSPQEQYLNQILADYEQFKAISLRGSQSASHREARTLHALEYLDQGAKPTLQITNYLGGTYYLTADEVIRSGATYIIQESKNTKGALPSIADIKDGLFKLILFSNLSELKVNGEAVLFTTRLRLTGSGIVGSLLMPCSSERVDAFLQQNRGVYRPGHATLIRKLNTEAAQNAPLQIIIGGNALAATD